MGWRRSRSGAGPSPLPTPPIVEPGVDRDRDAPERDGDEHPAQRVEIRHQRQDRGLGLGDDALRHLDSGCAQRPQVRQLEQEIRPVVVVPLPEINELLTDSDSIVLCHAVAL